MRAQLAVLPRAERSPQRARLAAAIGRRTASEEAVAAARAARARGAAMVEEAEEQHAAAEAAVSSAVAAMSEQMAAAARGGVAPAGGTRAARATLAEAEDRLTAARSALEVLRGALTQAEEELRRATSAVHSAAGAVLGGVAARLTAEIERDQLALVRQRNVLRMLVRRHLVAADAAPAAAALLRRPSLLPTLEEAHRDDESAWARAGGVAEWEAALAALQRDADAPLPDKPGD